MSNLSYQGNSITQRDGDGYVNATQMAKANDARFDNWIATENAKEYLKALQESDLLESQENNKTLIVVESKGFPAIKTMWVHPLVAIAFAQWISPRFHVWCNQHIKTLLETGKTTTGKFKHNLEWYDRLLYYKARTKIEVGYFSIFEELNNSIISELEHSGYTLPLGSVPDISVGQCFCNYLRSIGYNLEKITKLYTHYYPDGRVVKANVYSDEVLAIFRKWLQLTYKTTQFPKYLKGKDPLALPTLNQLLGLPDGAI
jgi:hypothetical protein